MTEGECALPAPSCGVQQTVAGQVSPSEHFAISSGSCVVLVADVCQSLYADVGLCIMCELPRVCVLWVCLWVCRSVQLELGHPTEARSSTDLQEVSHLAASHLLRNTVDMILFIRASICR
jgi:hypothetical protein